MEEMSMEHISNVIDRVMKYFFNFACRTYKILNRYENDNEKTNFNIRYAKKGIKILKIQISFVPLQSFGKTRQRA